MYVKSFKLRCYRNIPKIRTWAYPFQKLFMEDLYTVQYFCYEIQRNPINGCKKDKKCILSQRWELFWLNELFLKWTFIKISTFEGRLKEGGV